MLRGAGSDNRGLHAREEEGRANVMGGEEEGARHKPRRGKVVGKEGRQTTSSKQKRGNKNNSSSGSSDGAVKQLPGHRERERKRGRERKRE